jgi:hypothetical protein
MDDTREKLITRVQKLLERAELDQEPERSIAEAEARRVIAKHGITDAELKLQGRQREKTRKRKEAEEVPSGFGVLLAGPWEELESPLIGNLITTFFGSTVVCFGGDMTTYIVGPRICVACDIQRYRWLLEHFRSSWEEHRQEPLGFEMYSSSILFGPAIPRMFKPDKNSFYLGLFEGMRQSLLRWRLGQMALAQRELQRRGARGERITELVHLDLPPAPPPPPPAAPGDAVAVVDDDGPPPPQMQRSMTLEATSQMSLNRGREKGAALAQTLIPREPPRKPWPQARIDFWPRGLGFPHAIIKVPID